MSEAQVLREIMAYLATRHDVFAFRSNTGVAQKKARFVRFGLKGQADITGVIAPTGRFLAIEAKNEAGRQTADQKKFQRAVEKYGGLYILARSVAAVVGALPEYDPSLYE